MIEHPAYQIVSALEQLSAWGVIVGPAGMHIHFGRQCSDKHGGQTGEYSVWLRCAVQMKLDHVFVADMAFPNEEGVSNIKSNISGFVVVSAGIDRRNSSLRILFSSGAFLSAFPDIKDSELCWVIFQHDENQSVNIAVYKDCFDGNWEHLGGDS